MSEKNSFKLMSRSGVIKRTDTGMFIRKADIHQREGFNLRDKSAPDYQADCDALDAHIAAGGHVPPLEVVARDEGGVWIVEGHRRDDSFARRIAAGQVIEWIRIDPFIGNDTQQAVRILTSQDNRKLKPLEIAEGYRRLLVTGHSVEDIARFVHKTRQHVDQMLILATAPNDVQQAVKTGEISATDATKLARQGDTAAKEKLQEGRAAAKAAGKTKITAGVTKQWTPPAKIVAPLIDASKSVNDTLSKEDRKRLAELELSGNAGHGTTIVVGAAQYLNMLAALRDIEDARTSASDKARQKAEKAAQMAIPGADGA